MATHRAPETRRPDPYVRMHSVTIYVRDQDRSIHFFVDQLGFTLTFDVRFESGGRWVAVSPPEGDTVLTLVAPDPDSREYKLIGRATQVTFVTEDVLARYREWRERGVRFQFPPRLKRVKYERLGPVRETAEPDDDETPVWGGVFTRFRDVDGNTFALVGYDKLNQQIEAARRAAAAKAEAERRSAQELEIAKQVQARLFPQTRPPTGSLEYEGLCLQARQVGGDYYDFLNLSGDRLGLVIGDISGKGMAAALLMANLQANLRSQCAIAFGEPRRFLRSVNQLFYENTPESSYATLFFAEYDDRSRRLRYANCGHLCALLLKQDGSLERLHSTATVLGLFAEWDCDIEECGLAQGDTLVLYTDGVTEAFNDDGEQFGEERLISVLREHRDCRSGLLLNRVVESVRRHSLHEQDDDITLVVARCTG